METTKEVSLGFAEFVSQLLHETFDAVLSSQNYQMERLAELSRSLHLPTEEFADQYVTAEELTAKMNQQFNVSPNLTDKINNEIKSVMLEQHPEAFSVLITEDKLTELGLVKVQEYIRELVVRERKSVMRYLINQSEASRLIVSSGEIVAKIELSSLHTTGEKDTSEPISPPKIAAKKMATAKKGSGVQLEAKYENINVPFKSVKDVVTGKDIILMSKVDLQKQKQGNYHIPSVRLAAKPVSTQSSSNLYSQITINFTYA